MTAPITINVTHCCSQGRYRYPLGHGRAGRGTVFPLNSLSSSSTYCALFTHPALRQVSPETPQVSLENPLGAGNAPKASRD